MAHLDFYVEDVEEGVKYALSCGATMSEIQLEDDWRVMLDPTGPLPIISGAIVSWVYDISGTLIKVPVYPITKQHKAKTTKPLAGRIPLTAETTPRAPIASAAIKNRRFMPPHTPMTREAPNRPAPHRRATRRSRRDKTYNRLSPSLPRL